MPCLFMQGASGDLGPRLQYTDDVRVAMPMENNSAYQSSPRSLAC